MQSLFVHRQYLARRQQTLIGERLQCFFHVGPGSVLGEDGAAANLESLRVGARVGIVGRMVAGQPTGKRGVAALVPKQGPPTLRPVGQIELFGKTGQLDPSARNEGR